MSAADPAEPSIQVDRAPTLSLVIPVFRNEGNIPPLLDALAAFARENRARFALECVFVVDGSPDRSFELLREALPSRTEFRSQLHALSRNFGAPFALRTGLTEATGDYFVALAADQQEPLEAILRALGEVHDKGHDICFGQRIARDDPLSTRLTSAIYWFLYRRFVQPDIPPGGVDFFVCNRRVRDELLRLREKNSFHAGLLFWLGFRRALIPYKRERRTIGRSSWSLRKRLAYFLDSVFAFSDLPIKVLLGLGAVGLCTSVLLGCSIVVSRLTDRIPVPGYAATATLILFFGGLNSLGLGIIGEYVWRVFENTKARPHSIVSESHRFGARDERKVEP